MKNFSRVMFLLMALLFFIIAIISNSETESVQAGMNAVDFLRILCGHMKSANYAVLAIASATIFKIIEK
jgi:hypothetical protein